MGHIKMMVFGGVVWLSVSVAWMQAYFFNVQEWGNGIQKLFLFSDHHLQSQAKEQRIELLNAAEKLESFVIVEDHGEKNGVVCSNVQSETPLVGLTDLCRQRGIMTRNVEFRFYKNIEDFIYLHNQVIAQLIGYHDGLILDEFYRGITHSKFNADVTKVLTCMFSAYAGMSMTTFFTNSTVYDPRFDSLFVDANTQFFADTQDLSVEQKLLADNPYATKKRNVITAYDLSLIDAQILHEIHNNQKNSCIFVCAGGMHILNITKILPQLGFNFIRSAGPSLQQILESPGTIVHISKFFEI